MVTSCAVVGCTSSWNPFTDVSFHRVTKNKKMLPLWRSVVDLKTYNHAKICSLHFRPEDLVDYRDGKRLKWDAVPIVNVIRNGADDTDDDSFEEDEEDNKNLSMLKKLLTSDSNHGTAATQDNYDDDSDNDHPRKFEVVISSCNSTTCNSVKTAKSKEMKSTSTQVNRTTDGEIALRQRVKVLGMRLKRRDAKISYMKTVFNMIKKNVKGTDMEYKLSCELQNISNFSEPIRSNVKNNTRNPRPANPESPVSDCINDDEESSADENGMSFEVTLSPNLTPRNGVKF